MSKQSKQTNRTRVESGEPHTLDDVSREFVESILPPKPEEQLGKFEDTKHENVSVGSESCAKFKVHVDMDEQEKATEVIKVPDVAAKIDIDAELMNLGKDNTEKKLDIEQFKKPEAVEEMTKSEVDGWNLDAKVHEVSDMVKGAKETFGEAIIEAVHETGKKFDKFMHSGNDGPENVRGKGTSEGLASDLKPEDSAAKSTVETDDDKKIDASLFGGSVDTESVEMTGFGSGGLNFDKVPDVVKSIGEIVQKIEHKLDDQFSHDVLGIQHEKTQTVNEKVEETVRDVQPKLDDLIDQADPETAQHVTMIATETNYDALDMDKISAFLRDTALSVDEKADEVVQKIEHNVEGFFSLDNRGDGHRETEHKTVIIEKTACVSNAENIENVSKPSEPVTHTFSGNIEHPKGKQDEEQMVEQQEQQLSDLVDLGKQSVDEQEQMIKPIGIAELGSSNESGRQQLPAEHTQPEFDYAAKPDAELVEPIVVKKTVREGEDVPTQVGILYEDGVYHDDYKPLVNSSALEDFLSGNDEVIDGVGKTAAFSHQTAGTTTQADGTEINSSVGRMDTEIEAASDGVLQSYTTGAGQPTLMEQQYSFGKEPSPPPSAKVTTEKDIPSHKQKQTKDLTNFGTPELPTETAVTDVGELIETTETEVTAHEQRSTEDLRDALSHSNAHKSPTETAVKNVSGQVANDHSAQPKEKIETEVPEQEQRQTEDLRDAHESPTQTAVKDVGGQVANDQIDSAQPKEKIETEVPEQEQRPIEDLRGVHADSNAHDTPPTETVLKDVGDQGDSAQPKEKIETEVSAHGQKSTEDLTVAHAHPGAPELPTETAVIDVDELVASDEANAAQPKNAEEKIDKKVVANIEAVDHGDQKLLKEVATSCSEVKEQESAAVIEHTVIAEPSELEKELGKTTAGQQEPTVVDVKSESTIVEQVSAVATEGSQNPDRRVEDNSQDIDGAQKLKKNGESTPAAAAPRRRCTIL